jgi:hypothetical protein
LEATRLATPPEVGMGALPSERTGEVGARIAAISERIQNHSAAIAGWYSTEKDVLVGGTRCALVLRGNTAQMRTYLFSRIVRGFMLPKWEVATFLYDVADGSTLSGGDVRQYDEAVWTYMQHYQMRWSWLYLVSAAPFSSGAISFARTHHRKEIGLVLVDEKNRRLEYAPGMFLPRFMKKFVKF